MIEMQHAESDADFFFDRNKEQQQGHRIRATRDANTHAIALTDKPTALNRVLQPLR
jgi:hypothetical protein